MATFDIFGDNSTVALYEFENNATVIGSNYDGTWSSTESYNVSHINNCAKIDGNNYDC